MSMPHPASHPDKPTVFLIPWKIEGTASVQARDATEAELKFAQLHMEDIAASGELMTFDAKPAEDAP